MKSVTTNSNIQSIGIVGINKGELQPVEVGAGEPGVLGMLAQAGLPVEDLVAGSRARIFVLGPPVSPQALVGLELYGKVGLLRSLVVSPPLRGRGLGKMLVAFVEAKARLEGAEELFLLTTSARDFFEQLGYEGIERCLAPEALQNTAEFSSICPQSALLMRKRLAG